MRSFSEPLKDGDDVLVAESGLRLLEGLPGGLGQRGVPAFGLSQAQVFCDEL